MPALRRRRDAAVLPAGRRCRLTGTLGAFIRIRSRIPSKIALFDIGIAGPIAGFVVAVPALFVGLGLSEVVRLPEDQRNLMSLGEPLLFRLAAWLVFGDVADGYSINMHPMAFAAWFGLLATALNLFPDRAARRRAHQLRGAGPPLVVGDAGDGGVAIGLTFVSSSWIAWTVMLVVMLVLVGPRHPPTLDDDTPLGSHALWLAVVALVMLIVCFTPAPIEPFVRITVGRSTRAVRTPSEHRHRIDVDRARRASVGLRVERGRSASRIAVRFVPLRKNCARCSPRSLVSGAGAGPSSTNPGARAARRRRPALRRLHGLVEGLAAHDDVDHRHVRRVAHRPPVGGLLVEERRVVLRAGEADAVVGREQRLHDGLARAVAAAGAARHLRQQLERALGGAEIRQPEPDVGRDHADQGDVREVVALRDHLRADEHVDLAPASRSRISTRLPFRRTVSRSTRATRASGKRLRISASTRSVPNPTCSRYGAAHCGQVFGTGAT